MMNEPLLGELISSRLKWIFLLVLNTYTVGMSSKKKEKLINKNLKIRRGDFQIFHVVTLITPSCRFHGDPVGVSIGQTVEVVVNLKITKYHKVETKHAT